MTPHPLLAKLNTAQQEAVSLPIGPAQIMAGPGSGKTRVLTHRIAWLIRELDVARNRILAVTFTNKAAGEMRLRALELLESLDQDERGFGWRRPMAIGTFHSICARILRVEHEHTPYARNWIIVDADDQKSVIKEILASRPASDNNEFAVLADISRAKDRGLTASEFAAQASSVLDVRLAPIYADYEKALRTNNALDFDDLLLHALRLFRGNQDVLDRYRARWPHVLVDEFQDTNGVQYELVKLLAAYPDSLQSLFVVGDEDQSIYAFRGANRRNLARLRQDFPSLRTVVLEENYRSTQQILDVANSLIQHNRGRTHKELFTGNPDGQQVVLVDAAGGDSEADWIARSTAGLLHDGAFGHEDIAVMYRTHALSRALEEAFLNHRIAYRLIGAVRFYDRAEIKDALAFLRFLVNPLDALSLARIINKPARGIGAKTLARLIECRDRWGLSISDTLTVACRGPEAVAHMAPDAWERHPSPFTGRALRSLQAFESLAAEWRERLYTEDLTIDAGLFLADVLESSGYRARLVASGEQDEHRLENLDELVGLASEFEPESDAEELALNPVELFLEHVSLISAADERDDDEPKITLMTLHNAKGLEYPVVYIPGVDEDLLPHFRARDTGDREDIEEERRLLYVGVTRAERLLFLTRADQRFVSGRTMRYRESRFLNEIDPGLLIRETWPQWRAVGQGSSLGGRQADAYRLRPSRHDWSSVAADADPTPAAPAVAQFKAGMSVRHRIFGTGKVIGSKLLADGDEEVTVAFREHGLKTVMNSIAGLEPA